MFEKTIGLGKKELLKSDEGAKYCKVIEYNVNKIEPQVSAPHLPSNAGPDIIFAEHILSP